MTHPIPNQDKKYTAAQDELKRILNEQQTVSVPKLRRLMDTLNVRLYTGKTPESVEVAYLKKEIRKREKKLSIIGKKLKKAEEQSRLKRSV